jgi:NADH-quinone oxidoreductase subunit G/NADP-reducing hydrogenase subunit HndD
MASSLRELGFDYIFDTNFAADLTIIEEGSEFLKRVSDHFSTANGAILPMITSCSPGWIKYVEHQYPEKLGHLSSCKSPHMMLGALIKSYFAKKIQSDPKDLFVVSVMPCTAKKFEITRPEMESNGVRDVDAVLTTRELARMIKDAGIDFAQLPDSEFDSPLGLSSGAADIFGTTGGVMEAALRTVYELVTGRELPMEKLHVAPLAGLKQIKTAALKIENPVDAYKFLDGVTVQVAVTSGLKGASKLMEEIRLGKSPYHFIEVMGCPGGCISGGGQPRPVNNLVRMKRLEAIYREDEGKLLRKSHLNEDLQTLYTEFLGQPLGHLSHELLHTTYQKRDKN